MGYRYKILNLQTGLYSNCEDGIAIIEFNTDLEHTRNYTMGICITCGTNWMYEPIRDKYKYSYELISSPLIFDKTNLVP